MQSFNDVLDTGSLPNPLADAQLLAGKPLEDLIYLSLGETWKPPAEGLVEALGRLPGHAHGYTLSPYGYPALRTALRRYIERTHDLSGSEPFDVSVSQAGTRSAMADFAQMVQVQTGGRWTALLPHPGWDYAGTLDPAAFDVRHYPLRAETGWQPDVEMLAAALGPRTLLVLNPQHNPTGAEWTGEIVAALIEHALERGAAILIDDAYYALHAPDGAATNALRLLVERAGEEACSPWLAVRTMGKQFRSNGWGIGALAAPPQILAQMAQVAGRRTYGTAVPLQAAMADWLENPQSDVYVDELRQHYADNRALATLRLVRDLGFPGHAVHAGCCTSYMRFQVPERFVRDNDEEAYRRACLTAGVLPGRGSMTHPVLLDGSNGGPPHVRLHLGHGRQTLDLAFDRLREAGLGWKS